MFFLEIIQDRHERNYRMPLRPHVRQHIAGCWAKFRVF